MRVRLRKPAFALLALLALLPLADATYLLAKAQLAQHLIKLAWKDDQTIRKPWPWADTWPVAHLTIKSVALDAWVLKGASGNALAFGPGMADGSARPGDPGVVLIGGHRDTHFKPLQHVSIGDLVHLEDKHHNRHTYRIERLQVADARHERVHNTMGSKQLVLVTCYPFNAITAGGPLRYVVTASLITSDAPKPQIKQQSI